MPLGFYAMSLRGQIGETIFSKILSFLGKQQQNSYNAVGKKDWELGLNLQTVLQHLSRWTRVRKNFFHKREFGDMEAISVLFVQDFFTPVCKGLPRVTLQSQLEATLGKIPPFELNWSKTTCWSLVNFGLTQKERLTQHCHFKRNE